MFFLFHFFFFDHVFVVVVVVIFYFFLSRIITYIELGLDSMSKMALSEPKKTCLSAKSRRDTSCLLYTSDAADDTPCVDLGGRRINKKKKQ